MAKRMGRPPSEKTLVMRAAVAAFEAGTKVQSPRAKYDAAGTGRRMAGWNPASSGPNRALEGLQRIRNRARDVSRNDWSGESGVQKWTTSLIGIGITPRFKRVKSATRRRDIVDLWNDFVAKADADCVLSLYGLQTLITRSWLDAGEVFIRRRGRFEDQGLPVPVQVQVLEAEFVPMLDADNFRGLPAGNKIRSGIELDNRGQRIAYWFFKEHPGDDTTSYAADDLVRILARDVSHVFEPKRPGQLRGVSMLAPVLNRLKNIENFDDATLTRQQLANLVVGFITRGLPTGDDDDDINPLTNQPHETGPAAPLLGMQPGLLQELEDGQKVEWSNPPEAGTTYSDYMRTQHLGTAAAAGVPYEIFSGDIVNVSDRTLRVVINEFRRFNEQRQWQIIIPMACQRIVEWFADAALLVNKIEQVELDDVRRVEHAPHGWAHIHPVQDPTGKKVEVDAGFRSRSSVVGERGDDIYEVDDERQQDDAREQKLKVGLYSAANKKPKPTVAPAPAPAPKPTAMDVALLAITEMADARAALSRAQADRAKKQETQVALSERIVTLLEADSGR
jgi:lambda family phage portal protein